ncbi:MAG: M1 family aminopeptidase [Ginsengibacter sp.]
MKTRFLILSIFSVHFTYAQIVHDYCKQVIDISLSEANAHSRLTRVNSAATILADNIDVKYYRCEWNVDPSIRYIKGNVSVTYKLLSPANSIYLDMADELIVDSIHYHNQVITGNHTANVLKIILPAETGSGTLDSVTIFYQGVPPNTGFGAFVQSSHSGTPILWTLSEPYGSRDWWPCKNGNDDKADSIDVTIIHPSLYKAASNGLLQNEILSGTNLITHWKHRYPIATYLVCFAVTNYTVLFNSVQLGSKVLPMVTYAYPESAPVFVSNTPLVLNTLKFYNDLVGEYPFIKEKYGHVQFGWGGGQEHQTSTFIVYPEENLMAHELAHQWFGDKITCANWQDVWLNEGFATHFASMDREIIHPGNILPVRKEEIDYITSIPGGSVWVDDTTNVYRIFDGRLSYYKGSHLLYMLRWKLGDSVFFRAIRNYLTDPAVSYGFAKTDDLKRNLEKASGQNLDKFFKDWFYGQGYPSYHVKWSQAGDSYVRVVIEQSTSHPSVNFFNIPLALKFKNATQEKTIILDSKFSGESFFEKIGFVADSVIIDPDYWIISNNNISEKITVNENAENSIQVFPNPVQNQFYIYLKNFASPGATLTLWNSLGQQVFTRKIFLLNGTDYEEIPSRYLAAGVYYLKIQSREKVQFIKKILKQ